MPCSMGVQVDPEGNIAIIHSVGSLAVKERVGLDTGTYFGAFWDNNMYPTALANCGGVCVVHENTCVCNSVSVQESAVFSRLPTVEDIMASLDIGASNPSLHGAGTYHLCTAPLCSLQSYKTYFSTLVTVDSGIAAAFNSTTIFELTTGGAPLFLSNTKSTVQIGTGQYSFRNAPMFNSPIDPTQRDGLAETDAVLHQYVDHPNTAPFIATKLINHLVSSNPSPRYVKAAADAFRTGFYVAGGQSFGAGIYGVSSILRALDNV